MRNINTETAIRKIVKSSVESYASAFCDRHISEYDNPNGTINMKIHNVFISALGEDIQYYSALVRSLDSSLGNMLEKMAINIAELFFQCSKSVEGELYAEQTSLIAHYLEKYKTKRSSEHIEPQLSHYKEVANCPKQSDVTVKPHNSDYYLYDEVNNIHYLIELKIGGDLDNKKARSEKEALFEQYAILSNKLGQNSDIKCYFATAYNRFGERSEWKQQRVLQFFSKDELLIGKDFWNFVCCSDNGYNIVIDEYKKNSYLINNALNEIKEQYLG